MKSKAILIILVIFLAISAFYNIKFMRYMKEEDRKEHVAFNLTLSGLQHIQQGLKQLEECYDTGNYSELGVKVSVVVENLYAVDQLLSDTFYLVSPHKFSLSPFLNFKQIGSAMNGRLKDQGYQGSFAEDGVLSEPEIKFIRQLDQDLEISISSLVGEDKLNINPELTIGEYKKSLNEFAEKWYFGRASSEFSPYDYIKAK
ncbi:hypothetical protein [Cohnella sp. AR92]|uniref:hypothetical protein n=1 Tax=Cohnella sp. AR92 TaxID=648716 RepID=UPI000F8DBBDE|nr:hypothetical protein [Cohnella sp. AR92]RUS47489.1 hypothetical protein ELR57_10250 [Cohnella sp. AR92]